MENIIENIDTEKLSCGWHEVQFIRIELPLLFWVRFKTGEATLTDLLIDLLIYMGQRGQNMSLWPNQIGEGEAVATRDNQGEWQRGEILKIDQTRGKALVALADHLESLPRTLPP